MAVTPEVITTQKLGCIYESGSVLNDADWFQTCLSTAQTVYCLLNSIFPKNRALILLEHSLPEDGEAT